MRGGIAELEARSDFEAGRLATAWDTHTDADRYRVRLHAADGTLVIEEETRQTRFELDPAELDATADSASLYWTVEALDALGHVVARSSPVAADRPER